MSLPSLLKLQAGIFILFLWGLGLPAQAVTVDGLYTVQVPVASSAPDDLEEGYREGLERVLARVSGSRDLLDDQRSRDLLANAQSLVQSYQFLRAGEQGQSDQLRMTFGAVGVNRALASIEAPVWGANRPLTLAWIVVEERGGRELLVNGDAAGSQTEGHWRQAFADAAERRGLPVVLPPADRRGDQRLLSEVWGQFMGRVKEASATIDHNLLAVVKINRTGGEWQAAWRLEGDGIEDSAQSVRADSPAAISQRVIDAWADLLAERYAVAAGEVADSARVDIVVDQVNSLQDYAQVISALDRMTPINTVDPVRVTASRITLKVSVAGEVAQLRQYIALDKRFQEMRTNMAGTDSGAPPESGAVASGEQAADTGASNVVPGPLGVGLTIPGSVSEVENNGDLGPVFQYRPLEMAEEDSEESFESLYETLRYRWQSAPVVQPDARQD